MPQLPVFVISLAKARERRRSICAHLDALGVEYALIDAVEGAALTEQERREVTAEGADLLPGEIGCALSHLIAWRRIAEGPAPAGLILEDDARLDARFVPLLREGLQSYDFDYLFLDVAGQNDRGLVAYDPNSRVDLGGPFRSYVLSDGGEGAHAMIMTKAAAAQRVRHALPVRAPADVWHLVPYPIRFRAILGVRAAYLGLSSLQSNITKRNHPTADVRGKWLRQFAWFYDVRDLVSPGMFKRRREVGRMTRAGALPAGRPWRPLPPGRNLVPW